MDRVLALAFSVNGEHIMSGGNLCFRVWRVKDDLAGRTATNANLIEVTTS
jgi:hypothetical protein